MIITKQGEWSQILQRKGIEGLIKYLQNSSNKKIVLK
ncbi:hypothetical protein [bacterium endosymbiont of Pedicinus badii]|nr:hypothetical protein [bacterium endosymbiont of Pedicinus badii]